MKMAENGDFSLSLLNFLEKENYEGLVDFEIDPSIFDEEMVLPENDTCEEETHIASKSSVDRPPIIPSCSSSGDNLEISALESHPKPLQDREEVQKFITEQENTNTMKKTLNDIKKFQKFLNERGEQREIHHVPVHELDTHMSVFLMTIKKPNGQDYETTTIRNMVSSFDRKLRRHGYPHTIIGCKTNEFNLTRETLKAKMKILKRSGKGNRPNEADPLTDADISIMYKKGLLGLSTPESLLNTVWLNNCIHFGMRGVTEHYQLRWGDVSIKKDGDDEYLELNERQTKTRNGENLSDTRKLKPKLFSSDSARDPVNAYKFYASKRPFDFNKPDSPFYLSRSTRTTPLMSASDQWFLRQRVGFKKLSSLMKTMTAKAGLSGKRLTNHSARKHLVQKLRDNNIPPTEIMQMTGHKNIQSVINYSKMSNENQKKCSKILSSTATSASSCTVHEEPEPSNTSTVVTSSNEVQQSNNTDTPPHAFTPRQSTIDMPHFNISSTNNNQITPMFYGAVLNIGTLNVFPMQSMANSANGE